jgi:hypothetical protein
MNKELLARLKVDELKKEADTLKTRKEQLSGWGPIESTARATKENFRLIKEAENINKRLRQINKEILHLYSGGK